MSAFTHTINNVRASLVRTSPVWKPLVYLAAAFFIMSVSSAVLTKVRHDTAVTRGAIRGICSPVFRVDEGSLPLGTLFDASTGLR